MSPQFDDKDLEILKVRQRAYDAKTRPQCGDYVRFADGKLRRISHVWWDDKRSLQTSDRGSWYLHEGFASFSGSLFPGVPTETMTLTNERKDGRFWFFHHGFAQAYNGVHFLIPCRVWECNRKAPN